MDFYQYGRTFIEDFEGAVAGIFEDANIAATEVNYIDATLPAGFILLDELMAYQEKHTPSGTEAIDTYRVLSDDIASIFRLMFDMMAERLGVAAESETPVALLLTSLVHERLNDYRAWMDEFDELYEAQTEVNMLENFGIVLLSRLYPGASEFEEGQLNDLGLALGRLFLDYIDQAKEYIEAWYRPLKDLPPGNLPSR